MSDIDFPDVQTSDPDDYATGAPLGGNPVGADPSDSNPASDQVLYQMAMGAQPQDFHPALQPLAQGFSPLFQPSPPQTPGLLGSSDALQRTITPTPPTSAPSSTGADAAPADDENDSDDDSNAEGNADTDQDDGDDQADDGDDPSPPAPDSAQRLKTAQNLVLAKPEYRSGNGVTHCNQATLDIVRGTGADAAPFESAPGVAADANTQTRNLEKAANTAGSGWKKIDRGDAQAYANQGKTVVLGWTSPAGGHGHTVTVRPDTRGVASNPSLAQIGGADPGNGVHTFRQSFGQGKRDAVGAYVYEGH